MVNGYPVYNTSHHEGSGLGSTPVQAGVPVQPQPVRDNWKTELFACSEDGETCWWGAWCCCVVSARTSQSFDVGKPINRIYFFVAVLVVGIVLSMIFQSGLILFLGLGLYAGYQANTRQTIRAKLNIGGDYVTDLVHHTFCSCCSICQESREAKLRKMKKFDLCCGDPLESLSITACLSDNTGEPTHSPIQTTTISFHEEVPHLTTSLNPNGNASRVPQAQEVTFKDQCKKLSTTGRYIVYLWIGLGVLTMIFMTASQHPLTIFVMILVFLQPIVILYFIYWRYYREYASVDYVIKLFTIGFFMSTTQSIVFESILEWILTEFTRILIAAEDYIQGRSTASPDFIGNGVVGLVTFVTSFRHKHFDHDATATSGSFRALALQTGFHLTTVLTRMLSAPSAYGNAANGFAVAENDDPRIDNGGAGNDYNDDTTENNPDEADSPDDFDMKKYIVIVVISLFIMAFVIAAGVEETMKHFVVHCYQFSGRLKDPQTILIFLVTAALGFETAENIEYVFGSSVSPIRSHALVVNELFVLGMRQLMPIHAICAVLQATEYSKVALGTSYSSRTFFVLLPAIILHGSFDFFLFLIGALAQAYNIESAAFEWMSIIVPVLMTAGGIYWAYSGFTSVLKGPKVNGERQWSRANTDDTIDI